MYVCVRLCVCIVWVWVCLCIVCVCLGESIAKRVLHSRHTPVFKTEGLWGIRSYPQGQTPVIQPNSSLELRIQPNSSFWCVCVCVCVCVCTFVQLVVKSSNL